ncbi:MAG: hypothetical protein NWF00_11980 [Candidatus Bathyarchaeota archaeon]|nr:hypothetical protein [Candidatus Bathyarchaeota archaeon]
MNEYPSSGHELDVLAMTHDGISICLEVIWSASLNNFYRDMLLVHNSDSRIKIVVANPRIIENQKCQRVFEKSAISQRKQGVAFYGNMIDGQRILDDKVYIESDFKEIVLQLISQIQKQGKVNADAFKVNALPEPKTAKPIEETLLSNLFPVVSIPTFIYSSSTHARTTRFVFDKLGDAVKSHPFLPKNRRLYSFDNFKDSSCVFTPLIDKNAITEEYSSTWVRDDDKRNDLVYLLNLALKKYCEKRNMYYDRRHDRFVCLLDSGRDSTFTWRANTRHIPRKIAKKVFDKQGNLVFCLHYAARLNFMYLNRLLFLRIDPTKVFTEDGVKPINRDELAKLMSRYLSKEFNNLYLNSARFWAKYLSMLDINIRIPAGKQAIEIRTTPCSTKMPFGYEKRSVV